MSDIIIDGCRVRHAIRRSHPMGPHLSTDGTAFIRNAVGQWLVKWDNEHGLDIVHSSFLERVDGYIYECPVCGARKFDPADADRCSRSHN